MRNNSYLTLALRFVLLVLSQALIFNNLNYLGFINPMVSVLWVYWYPIKQNRAAFLLSTFLLGITIDMFSDTLAMNAAALITIAYLRPTMMRFVFGISYEFQNFKLGNTTTAQQMTFLALLIVVHHLFYFTLEVFSFSNVLLIFKKVVSVGAVTFIICALLGSLFSTEKE